MGYVTQSLPSGSTRALKLAHCESFAQGVCFNSKIGTEDGKSPCMYNMINDAGVLRTRDGQTALFSSSVYEGELYGSYHREISGHIIVHVGNALYAISAKDEEPVVLYDNMPKAKSIMVFFCGKLYIYCNTYVFSVDMKLNFKEENPEPAHYYVTGLSNSTVTKNTDINMIAPIVSVSFESLNSIIDSKYDFILPYARDTERAFRVYFKEALVSDDKYELVGNTIKINDTSMKDEFSNIRIEYYVKNPADIGFEDIFSRMTISESYGGETISGTRVFMTGNPDYPGRIYISDLLNPLRFAPNSYETIGTDSEDITGFMRQYGKLIVFTKNNVMRMTYDFSDGEPVYTVKELNSHIGCDMPESIQLIDNRIVFGNSKRGIFIIDSTEDFGEQNIKPLSDNINSAHELSFFECGEQERLNASSADFDRKYYLSVGDKMYVWDYGQCAYSDSGNYSKAQKRLHWYVFSGTNARKLFGCEGRLLCVCVSDGIRFAAFEKTGVDFGIPIHSYFESERLYLQYPSRYKSVEKLFLDIKSSSDTDVEAGAGDSNGKYYGTRFNLSGCNSKGTGITLRIPKKSVRRFYFSIGSDAPIELCGAAIYYRLSHGQD